MTPLSIQHAKSSAQDPIIYEVLSNQFCDEYIGHRAGRVSELSTSTAWCACCHALGALLEVPLLYILFVPRPRNIFLTIDVFGHRHNAVVMEISRQKVCNEVSAGYFYLQLTPKRAQKVGVTGMFMGPEGDRYFVLFCMYATGAS